MAGLCEIIERRVEQGFQLQPRDLRINSRARRIARPRQVAMYLIRVHTPKSLPEIGYRFGKDHTTVLSGYRRVIQLMQEDSEFAAKVESIRQSLIGIIPIHEGLAAVTIAEGLKSFPVSVFDTEFGPFPEAGAVSPPLQCAPANLRHSETKPVSHAVFYSEVRQVPPASLASKGVQIGQTSPILPAAYLDTHPFSGART